MNVEIGSDGLELSLAAQAGRTHAGTLRQIFDLRIKPRAEGVAWVFSRRNGGDFESRRKFCGQIFQRMHGEIDASGGEGLFNFFGENSFAQSALGADHGEGDIGDFISGGVDDFNFYFMAARSKKRGDEVSLAEGKLGAAGADAEMCIRDRVYTLATGKSHPVTHSLVAGVRSEDMVEPYLVHYPSRDGKWTISAFLYVPFNMARNGQNAAIVYIHGCLLYTSRCV